MWTRAAVAPRNINICEMPSHDDRLGAGRGQGAGACARAAASPSQCARALGWSPWGGQRGSCVLQVCVLPRGSWVPGLDIAPAGPSGRPGSGSAFLPTPGAARMLSLCPACYPGWNRLHV